jgi:hypothetical protein
VSDEDDSKMENEDGGILLCNCASIIRYQITRKQLDTILEKVLNIDYVACRAYSFVAMSFPIRHFKVSSEPL